jgi:hypothetical protein
MKSDRYQTEKSIQERAVYKPYDGIGRKHYHGGRTEDKESSDTEEK